MKRSINCLCLIIVAMITFAGCAKEVTETVSQTKNVHFFTESIETKTTFGSIVNDEYPTLWSDGDKVKILLNLETVAGTEKTVAVTPYDDYTSAVFDADITDPETTEYTFYSVSPASAFNGKSADQGRFTVTIPSHQTTLENSVDESAQVLYAESITTDKMPAEVELTYQHFTAYGKLTFTNLPQNIEIQNIVLESETVDLAGKWNYFVDTKEIAPKEAEKSITITTSRDQDVWFACAPVNVAGQTVTFIINTDQGKFKKDVIFRAGTEFKSGVVASFTINMKDIEPELDTAEGSFVKIESAPDDWSGTYLIVYEDEKFAFNGSLTTLDAANNYVEVSIEDNTIDATSDLLESTFEIGKNDSYYWVKSNSGYYIGRTANSNGLLSNLTTQYENTISINDNKTVNIISSGGAHLRFNTSNGQDRFRYFQSSTYENQMAISLYKYTNQ
ncbi:MAG: hypothetical protein IJN52_09590 [Bacteroidales bacterium]|nr:hypothetical protein [Bacteroidales bacterium]